MQWRRIALVIATASIVAFVLALYGILGPLSSVIAIVALITLLSGVGILVVTLRHEARGWPHWGVIIIVAVALGLHLYGGGPGVGYVAWGMLPYVLCMVISSFAVTRTAAVGGAVVALTFDAIVHYDVFTSTRSTAVLELLWIPMWNTLIFVPAGTAITRTILRRRSNAIAGAP